MELNAIDPWLVKPRNLSPTLWSVVAAEGPSVDAGDRLGRDATPRDTIPALFVGVAMTVEHISSEISVFAFRGEGDSTGGRARDLFSQCEADPQEELVGGTQ